jgi:hypothetical protein
VILFENGQVYDQAKGRPIDGMIIFGVFLVGFVSRGLPQFHGNAQAAVDTDSMLVVATSSKNNV